MCAAVKLSLSLLGTICFWSGIMEIASVSQFTKILSKLFRPLTKILFKGLDATSSALDAICMNMSANFLGLGNAATPLGITAMQKLQQISSNKQVASDHMITFVVLNTCSIQLIPTTIAALRLNAGSQKPNGNPACSFGHLSNLCHLRLDCAKTCNRLFPVKAGCLIWNGLQILYCPP